uniref:VWFC domain-containing protein n=1 Tax=Stomoxys calcitrans TaxID=35570 RepID=A0A1I8PVE1_STOCA
MTRKRSSPMGLDIYLSAMLAIVLLPLLIQAAPLQDYTEIQQYTEGCYYNYNHYNEGDRIMTNEPCLNCTCHNKMLMCYLRVCPFTKPIGHDCIVEKREDQCCPIITCPEVPVGISHAAPEPGTELSIPEKFGCSIDGKFYLEGAQVPSNPNKPCELCYCIKNRTSCLMQECTLHIDGCTPIYNKGSCCPVRYNCDHENDVLGLEDFPTTTETTTTSTSTTTTTERPTTGFILTSTMTPAVSTDCIHNGELYADGARIEGETACENCYCMRGDIICAVQECKMPMLAGNGKQCHAMPPAEGECCPSNYICEDDTATTEVYEATTLPYGGLDEEVKVTTSSPIKDLHGAIPEEDMQLQTHIDEEQEVSTDSTLDDVQPTESPSIGDKEADEKAEDKPREDATSVGIESATTSKPTERDSTESIFLAHGEEDKDFKPTVPDEHGTEMSSTEEGEGDGVESTTKPSITLDESHIVEPTTVPPVDDAFVTKAPSEEEATSFIHDLSTKSPSSFAEQSFDATDEHTTKAPTTTEEAGESEESIDELATKVPADLEDASESTEAIDEHATKAPEESDESTETTKVPIHAGESAELAPELATKAPVVDIFTGVVDEHSTKAPIETEANEQSTGTADEDKTKAPIEQIEGSTEIIDQHSTKAPTEIEQIEGSTESTDEHSTKAPVGVENVEEISETVDEHSTMSPVGLEGSTGGVDELASTAHADADESTETLLEVATKAPSSTEESDESTEIIDEQFTKAPVSSEEPIEEDTTKVPVKEAEASGEISDELVTKAPLDSESAVELDTQAPSDTKETIDDLASKAPVATDKVESSTEIIDVHTTKVPTGSERPETSTGAIDEHVSETPTEEQDTDKVTSTEISTSAPTMVKGEVEETTEQQLTTKAPAGTEASGQPTEGDREFVTDIPTFDQSTVSSIESSVTDAVGEASTKIPLAVEQVEESSESVEDIESGTEEDVTKMPAALDAEHKLTEQPDKSSESTEADKQEEGKDTKPVMSQETSTNAPEEAVTSETTDEHIASLESSTKAPVAHDEIPDTSSAEEHGAGAPSGAQAADGDQDEELSTKSPTEASEGEQDSTEASGDTESEAESSTKASSVDHKKPESEDELASSTTKPLLSEAEHQAASTGAPIKTDEATSKPTGIQDDVTEIPGKHETDVEKVEEPTTESPETLVQISTKTPYITGDKESEMTLEGELPTKASQLDEEEFTKSPLSDEDKTEESSGEGKPIPVDEAMAGSTVGPTHVQTEDKTGEISTVPLGTPEELGSGDFASTESIEGETHRPSDVGITKLEESIDDELHSVVTDVPEEDKEHIESTTAKLSTGDATVSEDISEDDIKTVEKATTIKPDIETTTTTEFKIESGTKEGIAEKADDMLTPSGIEDKIDQSTDSSGTKKQPEAIESSTHVPSLDIGSTTSAIERDSSEETTSSEDKTKLEGSEEEEEDGQNIIDEKPEAIDQSTDSSGTKKQPEAIESSTHVPSLDIGSTTSAIDRDSSEETTSSEDKTKLEGSEEEEEDGQNIIDEKPEATTLSPATESITQPEQHKVEETSEGLAKPTDSPMVIIEDFSHITSDDKEVIESTIAPSSTTDKVPSLDVKGDFDQEVPEATVKPSAEDISVEDMHDMNLPSVIPGEGDCLVGRKTYANNSVIPTSDECEISCKCISSIVSCERVMCNVPQNVDKCVLDEASTNKCCPSYICGIDSLPPKEGESSESTEEDEDEEIEFTTIGAPHRIPEKDGQETASPIIPEIEMPVASTEEPMSHIRDSDEDLQQSTKSPVVAVGDDKVDILTDAAAPTTEATKAEDIIKPEFMVPVEKFDDKQTTVHELPSIHKPDEMKPTGTTSDESQTSKPIEADVSTEISDEEIDHTSKPIESVSTEADKKFPEITDIEITSSTVATPVFMTTTSLPGIDKESFDTGEAHTEVIDSKDHEEVEESSGEIDHQAPVSVIDQVHTSAPSVVDTTGAATHKPLDMDESTHKETGVSAETPILIEEYTVEPIKISTDITEDSESTTISGAGKDEGKESVEESIGKGEDDGTHTTPAGTEVGDASSTISSLDKESMDNIEVHTVSSDHTTKPLDHTLAPSVEEKPSISITDVEDHTEIIPSIGEPDEAVTEIQTGDEITTSPIDGSDQKVTVMPIDENLEGTISPIVDGTSEEASEKPVSSTSPPMVTDDKTENRTPVPIDGSNEDEETQTTVPEFGAHSTLSPLDADNRKTTDKPIDFDVTIDATSEGASLVPSVDEAHTTRPVVDDFETQTSATLAEEGEVSTSEKEKDETSSLAPTTISSADDGIHKDTTAQGEVDQTTLATIEKVTESGTDDHITQDIDKQEQEGEHVTHLPSGEDGNEIKPSMAHTEPSLHAEKDEESATPVTSSEEIDESAEDAEHVTVAPIAPKEPSLDLSEEASGESVESEEEKEMETKPVHPQHIGAYVTERVDDTTDIPTSARPTTDISQEDEEGDTSGEEDDTESDNATVKPDVHKIDHATPTKIPQQSEDVEIPTSELPGELGIDGITSAPAVGIPEVSTTQEATILEPSGTDDVSKISSEEGVPSATEEAMYVEDIGSSTLTPLKQDIPTGVTEPPEASEEDQESSAISSSVTKEPELTDHGIEATTSQYTEGDVAGITKVPESDEAKLDVTKTPMATADDESVTAKAPEEDISSVTKAPDMLEGDNTSTSKPSEDELAVTKVPGFTEGAESSTSQYPEDLSSITKVTDSSTPLAEDIESFTNAPATQESSESGTSEEVPDITKKPASSEILEGSEEELSDVTNAPVSVDGIDSDSSHRPGDVTGVTETSVSATTHKDEAHIDSVTKSPGALEGDKVSTSEESGEAIDVTKAPISVKVDTSKESEEDISKVTEVPVSVDIEGIATEGISDQTKEPESTEDIESATSLEVQDESTKVPVTAEGDSTPTTSLISVEAHDVTAAAVPSDGIESTTSHHIEEGTFSPTKATMHDVESATVQQEEDSASGITQKPKPTEDIESTTDSISEATKIPESLEAETGTHQVSEDISTVTPASVEDIHVSVSTQKPEDASADVGAESITAQQPLEDIFSTTKAPLSAGEIESVTKGPEFMDDIVDATKATESPESVPSEEKKESSEGTGAGTVQPEENISDQDMSGTTTTPESADSIHIEDDVTEAPESDVSITAHGLQEDVSAVTTVPEKVEEDAVITKVPETTGHDLPSATKTPEYVDAVTPEKPTEGVSSVTTAPESEESVTAQKLEEAYNDTAVTKAPVSTDSDSSKQQEEEISSVTKTPESADSEDIVTKIPDSGETDESEEDTFSATTTPHGMETSTSQQQDISGDTAAIHGEDTSDKGPAEKETFEDHTKTPEISGDESETNTHKTPMQQADEIGEEDVTKVTAIGLEHDKTEQQIPADESNESTMVKLPEGQEHVSTELPAVEHDISTTSHEPGLVHGDESSEETYTETADSGEDKVQHDTTTVHPLFPHHGFSTTPSIAIDHRIDVSNTTGGIPTTTTSALNDTEHAEDEIFTTTPPAPSTTALPITPPAPGANYQPQPPIYGQAPQYPPQYEDEYTDEDETEIFGPGTCRYGGKLYVSAQQIPRDDPCDFCFCFRSDIICLQQSCPPPIAGCHEEPISGFCCPRYECPVSMATVLNITTSTTTTSTTLPPHFLHHSYGSNVQRNGCLINGRSYSVGERIESTSGPCINCTCGGDGKMKCDPQACVPEPTMQQVMAVVAAGRKR